MKPSIEEYQRSWQDRAKRRDQLMESQRLAAEETAMRLAGILAAQYQVQRVVLFGSATRPGGFSEGSDIDLAVTGRGPAQYFPALATLRDESTREVNLIPLEEATPLMRDRIAQGIVLYER